MERPRGTNKKNTVYPTRGVFGTATVLNYTTLRGYTRYATAGGTSLKLSPLRINTLVARYLFFSRSKYVDYIAEATNNVSISLARRTYRMRVHGRVCGSRGFTRVSKPSFGALETRNPRRFCDPLNDRYGTAVHGRLVYPRYRLTIGTLTGIVA